jgi:hypothetical protein
VGRSLERGLGALGGAILVAIGVVLLLRHLVE